MKFLLPMISIVFGIRVFLIPVIKSVKYGVVFDFTGYNYYIGAFFILIGALGLLEALGINPSKGGS